MDYTPDYNHILDAAKNRKPSRLPLYEHLISPVIMEKVLGIRFAALENGSQTDMEIFFDHYCGFFKTMKYDTVSYEVPIIAILPAAGESILGRKPGPIQSRTDFNHFEWDGLLDKFIAFADKRFKTLRRFIPEGMKAIGGVGNGVFEISEDLVGMEYLAYMQADDPTLFEDLYIKIGDTMTALWTWFLENHADCFAVCRFGDDLGYRSGTLISPVAIRRLIMPQYKRIIDLIHRAGHVLVWHSCGCIFEVMDEMIDLGIDAKHSNEDAIAPFEKWIDLYGSRIGLFGGIDVDLLCRNTPEEIYAVVKERVTRYRDKAIGYAAGSGNSIPDYIPVGNYLAMVDAVNDIRGCWTE
jgi:uroporphyrinogen decarboxylase